MEDDYTMVLQSVNEILKNKGSWLYDSMYYLPEHQKLFDPFHKDFITTTPEKKLLILKEYFYCGVKPKLLDMAYRLLSRQEEYRDIAHALLEIIHSVSENNLSAIDIHSPENWNTKDEENSVRITTHEAIILTLQYMSPELHSELIKQDDMLMRRRLLYQSHRQGDWHNMVVPNVDPILDRVDEELIRRVATYNENEKLRLNEIEDLAEDLHDEANPEHKTNKIEHVKRLIVDIEAQNIEALKQYAYFKNSNIEHFIDIKKYPIKYLYEILHPRAIMREVRRQKGIDDEAVWPTSQSF